MGGFSAGLNILQTVYPTSQHMGLSIDQHNIDEACAEFGISQSDYYITCTSSAIYMHWVATPEQIKKYFETGHCCLCVDIGGEWMHTDEVEDYRMPNRLTACRYILDA